MWHFLANYIPDNLYALMFFVIPVIISFFACIPMYLSEKQALTYNKHIATLPKRKIIPMKPKSYRGIWISLFFCVLFACILSVLKFIKDGDNSISKQKIENKLYSAIDKINSDDVNYKSLLSFRHADSLKLDTLLRVLNAHGVKISPNLKLIKINNVSVGFLNYGKAINSTGYVIK